MKYISSKGSNSGSKSHSRGKDKKNSKYREESYKKN